MLAFVIELKYINGFNISPLYVYWFEEKIRLVLYLYINLIQHEKCCIRYPFSVIFFM